MDGIGEFLGRVQDALQSSKTAIASQEETLLRGGCALFPVKEECRLYRLDVVVQPLFSIVRHGPL